MPEITLTAKIRLETDADSASLLTAVMLAYTAACNYVSNHVFSNKELDKKVLHDALYRDIRSRFGLKSQMAESVLKTVLARYKAIQTVNMKKGGKSSQKEQSVTEDKSVQETQDSWTRVKFRRSQYDLVWNRDYSFPKGLLSVNTLEEKRVKLPFSAKGMEQYFTIDGRKFGTARLVKKHNKFFLHIPVSFEIENCELSDICNVVGIDRGINFIIVTYDSNGKSIFVSGRSIKQKRANYVRVRRDLQKRKTPSARRRLKAIGRRENRWMQDVNHQVSKALVRKYPKHTIFVIEDLTGIRSATERVRKRQRCVLVSWAFYDLEQKLEYKAKLNQCIVLKVDPAYTSQTCPCCGHKERANRNKKLHLFTCKKCGYKSNDDRIGAMNLYRKGTSYLREHGKVPDTAAAEHVSAAKGAVNHPAM